MIPKKPLVSVIIPTHNRANMLLRAINSVLAQSYPNLEIIVIADSCTDDTLSQISNLQKQHVIHLFSFNQKLGGAMARNIGIDKSTGTFISFLDDDDYWRSNKIEMQLNFLLNNPQCDLVFCDYTRFSGELQDIIKLKQTVDLKDLLVINYISSFSFVMVRKNILDGIRINKQLKSCQDWDLWIKVLQRSGDVARNLNANLAFYQIHKNKKISSNISNVYQGHNLWYKTHYLLLSPALKYFHRIRIIKKKNGNKRKIKYLLYIVCFMIRFPLEIMLQIRLLHIIFHKEIR
jgi:glycosyltransferase involved in cell wall biosynthesis